MKRKKREIIEIYDPKTFDEILKKCIEKEYLIEYKKLYGKEK